MTQGALQFPQEVIITQVNSFVVDVIYPKFQFLHYFEVVVDDKLLCKFRVEAILDFLCASHLLGKIGLVRVFCNMHTFQEIHQPGKKKITPPQLLEVRKQEMEDVFLLNATLIFP